MLTTTAIGAHGGSYATYYALAVASKNMSLDHKADFTNTEPAVSIGPFPAWGDRKKIVAMDPLGHLAPWLYKDYIDNENIEIRPSIAITRAHMKLPELEQSVRDGRLIPDGKICLNESGEIAVTKFAVEPVWYLPGVAERFGIGELRLVVLHSFCGALQTDIPQPTTRRRHAPSFSIRTHRRLLPRTHHALRHQSLPPSHRRSDRLRLRRPCFHVKPRKTSRITCARRVQRI